MLTRKESWVATALISLNATPIFAQRYSRALWTLLAILLVAGASGCSSNTQRVQQLQSENDRLLSEYRAQRDQVNQLNERLATLQSRLAESEKLLARQSPMPSSRLSRLNSDPTSLPGFTSTKDRAPSSSTTTKSNAGGNSSPSDKDSASELYWRPMRREAP